MIRDLISNITEYLDELRWSSQRKLSGTSYGGYQAERTRGGLMGSLLALIFFVGASQLMTPILDQIPRDLSTREGAIWYACLAWIVFGTVMPIYLHFSSVLAVRRANWIEQEMRGVAESIGKCSPHNAIEDIL